MAGTTNGTKPKTSTPRVRLAGVVLQFQAFLDDGTSLTPVEVQPIPLAPGDLASFDPVVFVAQLQAQVDAQA